MAKVASLSGKQEELTAKRRDIIRRLSYLGKSKVEIITQGDKNEIFPSGFSWAEKAKMVESDLQVIHKEDREKLSHTGEDVKKAQEAYILRQSYLWEEAMSVKDLALAAQLSKDIAKAQGVQTDAPIEVKHNLADMLINMQTKKPKIVNEEKPQIEERKAIPLLPPQFYEVKETVPVEEKK